MLNKKLIVRLQRQRALIMLGSGYLKKRNYVIVARQLGFAVVKNKPSAAARAIIYINILLLDIGYSKAYIL